MVSDPKLHEALNQITNSVKYINLNTYQVLGMALQSTQTYHGYNSIKIQKENIELDREALMKAYDAIDHSKQTHLMQNKVKAATTGFPPLPPPSITPTYHQLPLRRGSGHYRRRRLLTPLYRRPPLLTPYSISADRLSLKGFVSN